MAEQENSQGKHEGEETKAKQPKLTRAGYQICMWLIAGGLLAQIVMAIVVYPMLPERIPTGWLGSSVPYSTAPSWVVFFWFPAAEAALLIVAAFSPKDEQGNRVMDSGLAWTLVLLAALFTALQASAFHLAGRLAVP